MIHVVIKYVYSSFSFESLADSSKCDIHEIDVLTACHEERERESM